MSRQLTLVVNLQPPHPDLANTLHRDGMVKLGHEVGRQALAEENSKPPFLDLLDFLRKVRHDTIYLIHKNNYQPDSKRAPVAQRLWNPRSSVWVFDAPAHGGNIGGNTGSKGFEMSQFFHFCIRLMTAFVLVIGAAAAEDNWRVQGAERIVAIPDIHGAYPEFVALLKETGLVDEQLNWSGGNTHLVSLGDLLDRGPESRNTMDLLMRLEQQAPEQGGRVLVVLGNHELMNLTGDMRYVARAEFAAFQPEEPADLREQAFQWFQQQNTFPDEDAARTAFEKGFPSGFFGLRHGFSTQGKYGQWLLGLPPVVVVNDTAFVHGGLPEIVGQQGLDELNRSLRSDLNDYVSYWEKLVDLGTLPRFENQDPRDLATDAANGVGPSPCIQERVMTCEMAQDPSQGQDLDTLSTLERFTELSQSPLFSADGPLWYRGSVYCKPILEEPVLDAALSRLGVNRVVVGHTPTVDRRAHSLYDGRVIMLDTGMLVSYYEGRPAALIVEGDDLTVQYLNPSERLAPRTGGQPIAGNLNRQQVMQALAEGTVEITSRGEKGQPWRAQVSHNGSRFKALFYPSERGRPDRLEMAAFILDQALGLDLVPPTAVREVNGKDGALQLWYADTITEGQRVANQIGIGGWCPVNPQFDLMSMFDYLTFNAGRNADNVLYRRSLWSLHLTGHGRAFGTQTKLPPSAADLNLPAAVVEALQNLEQKPLEESMTPWLKRKHVKALLARRDEMLRLTGN